MKKNILFKFTLFSMILISFTSCAILHHVQIGEIERLKGYAYKPFEIKVSETGISTAEIGHMARATKSSGGKHIAELAAIISLFQMGPRTGNISYSDSYTDTILHELYEKCPSGKISGLMSIREMKKYPGLSGEIVKIRGYCKIKKKKKRRKKRRKRKKIRS